MKTHVFRSDFFVILTSSKRKTNKTSKGKKEKKEMNGILIMIGTLGIALLGLKEIYGKSVYL